MALEIERKFLVKREVWDTTEKGCGELYSQGYMLTEPEKTIRVRLTETAGFMTIKGISKGATRTEYEYEIPANDAKDLLDGFCSGVIAKRRYKIGYSGMLWEVDEFLGANAGLLIAEIELPSEDAAFDLPNWAGTEVTGLAAYYNSYISRHPYCTWHQ